MPRQVIRLSEGLGGALLLLLAVSLTVLLAFVLAVSETRFLPDDAPLDELVLATDTPFWVAGVPVVSTATPEPTNALNLNGNTAVPTLIPTAVMPPDTSPTPQLVCPPPPAGWRPYTVQASDSLTGLAIQTGVTSAELMRVNCLTTAVLYIGMNVYLPSQAPTRVACGPPGSWRRYLVQRGDTLYSLALRYGTTVYQIMNANCMVGTQLTAGRYIYLPPTAVVPPTATPLPPTTPLPTLTPTAPPPPPATAVPPTATATPTAVPATPTNTPPSPHSPPCPPRPPLRLCRPPPPQPPLPPCPRPPLPPVRQHSPLCPPPPQPPPRPSQYPQRRRPRPRLHLYRPRPPSPPNPLPPPHQPCPLHPEPCERTLINLGTRPCCAIMPR